MPLMPRPDLTGRQMGVPSDDPRIPGRRSNPSMGPSVQEMSPAAKARFLQELGYAVGDKWNARTKAAWRNYMAARAGKKDVSKAAAYWSRNSKLSTEYAPPPSAQAPAGDGPAAGVAAPVSTVSNPYLDALTQGQELSADTLAKLGQMFGSLRVPKGVQVDPKLAKQGLTPYGPELLDSVGGVYDSQIRALQELIGRSSKETDANVKQIEGWYGHVGKALATAAERDKVIQQASLASVTDAARSVASAIGGEANPGASMAAQAGAQGAGLVSAMGAANDEFNSDIAPLIQAEGVSRMSEERTAGSNRAQELAMQIAQVRGEQGGAVGDARLKLAQLNNELKQQGAKNLIDILQVNAGSRQQDFQNQTGLFGLASGLASLGIDAFGKFMPDAPAAPKPKASPKPPSSSSLRQADQAAIQAVAALREGGAMEGPIRGGIPAALNAIQRAYGTNITSAPRALRVQMYRTAVAALPNVDQAQLARYFSLGK
jgi:hypothetical protein